MQGHKDSIDNVALNDRNYHLYQLFHLIPIYNHESLRLCIIIRMHLKIHPYLFVRCRLAQPGIHHQVTYYSSDIMLRPPQLWR